VFPTESEYKIPPIPAVIASCTGSAGKLENAVNLHDCLRASPSRCRDSPKVEIDFQDLASAAAEAGKGEPYGVGIGSGRDLDGSFFLPKENSQFRLVHKNCSPTVVPELNGVRSVHGRRFLQLHSAFHRSAISERCQVAQTLKIPI